MCTDERKKQRTVGHPPGTIPKTMVGLLLLCKRFSSRLETEDVVVAFAVPRVSVTRFAYNCKGHPSPVNSAVLVHKT